MYRAPSAVGRAQGSVFPKFWVRIRPFPQSTLRAFLLPLEVRNEDFFLEDTSLPGENLTRTINRRDPALPSQPPLILVRNKKMTLQLQTKMRTEILSSFQTAKGRKKARNDVRCGTGRARTQRLEIQSPAPYQLRKQLRLRDRFRDLAETGGFEGGKEREREKGMVSVRRARQ